MVRLPTLLLSLLLAAAALALPSAVGANTFCVNAPDCPAGALEYHHLAPTITTLDAPGGGNAGAPLAFNTGVTDPDGDQVQVRWDFGEGASATGTAVTHAFSAPGSFQAATTATDEAGLSDRRTFTVAIRPGTRTGPTGGGPTGTTTGGPTGTRTGVPVPPMRGTKLVLRGLRLTPSSTTVKRAARLRLRVSANKRATIRIVLAPSPERCFSRYGASRNRVHSVR